MTREEWLDVARVLNDAYEFNGKAMFETPDKVQFWFSCLQDLDYKILCAAVKKLAMTNPNRPTIASIREAYMSLADAGDKMSESEAWDMVRTALRDSTYHAEEQFALLPASVQRAVVSPDRLREWSALNSETVTSVVRAEFRRIYESAQKQIAEEKQIGDIGRNLIASVAERLSITKKGE